MTLPPGRGYIRLRLEELLAAIDAGTLAPVKRLLSHRSAVDVAHLLESSGMPSRKAKSCRSSATTSRARCSNRWMPTKCWP